MILVKTGHEGFYISSNKCIFTFSLLSFLCKGHTPSFGQSESTSPQNALCQVWLIFAWWSWKFFFKFCQCILLFEIRNYLFLEKGVALYLNKQTRMRLKLAQWIWRKGNFNVVNVFLLSSLHVKGHGPSYKHT